MINFILPRVNAIIKLNELDQTIINITVMKFQNLVFFLSLTILYNCTQKSNNSEFINKVSGRYLYNSDEVVEAYFKENELYLIWRGAKDIKPINLEENIFYVKEMNEKIQFLTNPDDQKDYIVLVPREENSTIKYNYKKLEDQEKIPREYLKNNEFNKALEGYQLIKEKDSLDFSINEVDLNSLGYKELRENNIDQAINIFKINVALYPTSSNVYDSLGEAYMKKGDTTLAIDNYSKSLLLDSGNARAKRNIERLQNKEEI